MKDGAKIIWGIVGLILIIGLLIAVERCSDKKIIYKSKGNFEIVK